MALIKKPPETVERHIRLDEPVSQLLDDHCRFIDCTPDYVTNFALRKMLAREGDCKKWKGSQAAGASGKGTDTPVSRTA
jgi:hypothetical protein